MKKNIPALIFVALFLTLVLWYLLSARKKTNPPSQPSQQEVVMQTNKSIKQTPGNLNTEKTKVNVGLQEPSHSASQVEWSAWERKMDKQDVHWQYKMPISFYGNVIDDLGQPVAGATIAFGWTDLSSDGTSQRIATSDQSGLFSLTGVTGKSLTVQVNKEGYKLYHSSNRSGFDYSPLSNPDRHYNPDPQNPVQYIMRKNGSKEPLTEINRRFPTSTNQPSIFKLDNDASTSVRIDLLENKNDKYGLIKTWAIRVSVPSGGIQISTNEFPFEAPEDGYISELVMTNNMPKPTIWPGSYEGGEFFVKTPAGYGRVHLQMLVGATHLSIVSYFNPSGSRNLEP